MLEIIERTSPEIELVEAPKIQVYQRGTNEQIVEMFLHGKAAHTQRSYRADIDRFFRFIENKPIAMATLPELQFFSSSLADLAPSSQAKVLSTIRSLISKAYKLGLIPLNVGASLDLPKVRDNIAQRILEESEILQMIHTETNARNFAILGLLYTGGLRVAEVSQLTWADMIDRDEGTGQVTVFGKGGKTRQVGIHSRLVWAAIKNLRDNTPDSAPVFVSQKGGNLDPSSIWRIVKKAAYRVKINKEVSPHWFRHACASHALDKGAPIHLVQQHLGHSNLATTSRYSHARVGETASSYLSI